MGTIEEEWDDANVENENLPGYPHHDGRDEGTPADNEEDIPDEDVIYTLDDE